MHWSDPIFAEFARVIGDATGLVFPPSRYPEIELAMRRVLPQDADLQRVRRLLADDGELREKLISDLTIGESYFFRDTAQFEYLHTEILPRLLAERAGTPIRVWSAGCASGEEPYSIAILLAQLGHASAATILGTDLSRERLGRAHRGAFRAWSLRGVPADIVDNYFERRGSGFLLDPAIRKAVEFRYLNLAEDRFPSLTDGIWGMDLILCRNVLIYFDAETIERVASRLVDCLSEDGLLICGASDPAISEITACDVLLTPAGLVYRRPGRAAQALGLPTAGVPDVTSTKLPELKAADTPTSPGVDVPESAATESSESAPAPMPGVPGAETPDVQPAATPDVRLAALEEAYRARDYDQVDSLAASLTRERIGSERPWVLWLRALANRGRLHDAGHVSAAALDHYPYSAELHYLQAVLFIQSERPADAVAAARRALYLDPALAVAQLVLADSRMRAGDRSGARRALRRAGEILAGMPADATVPASDGQSCARMLRRIRTQLSLLADAA